MIYFCFLKLYKACLQLIAPACCSYCRSFITSQAIFCLPCFERIQPIVSVELAISKNASMWAYAISSYTGPVKELILAKGSRNILASNQLGNLIWEHTYISYLNFDVIVPIPLHWSRYMVRGYNQAFEIALVVSHESKRPINSCLRRTKRTKYQASLSAEQRQQNVKNIFEMTKNVGQELYGKHILLVDDLLTSGATLREAARILLQYKPKKISVVVAARVV